MNTSGEMKALFKICAELQKHILQFHNEFDDVWKEMADLRARIDNVDVTNKPSPVKIRAEGTNR